MRWAPEENKRCEMQVTDMQSRLIQGVYRVQVIVNFENVPYPNDYTYTVEAHTHGSELPVPLGLFHTVEEAAAYARPLAIALEAEAAKTLANVRWEVLLDG